MAHGPRYAPGVTGTLEELLSRMVRGAPNCVEQRGNRRAAARLQKDGRVAYAEGRPWTANRVLEPRTMTGWRRKFYFETCLVEPSGGEQNWEIRTHCGHTALSRALALTLLMRWEDQFGEVLAHWAGLRAERCSQTWRNRVCTWRCMGRGAGELALALCRAAVVGAVAGVIGTSVPVGTAAALMTGGSGMDFQGTLEGRLPVGR